MASRTGWTSPAGAGVSEPSRTAWGTSSSSRIETAHQGPGSLARARSTIAPGTSVSPHVQLAVKRRLEGQGYDDWFGPLDRGYFISVYNRTPSGALFEYAYSKPESWAIDEPVDQLGQTFKVPPNLTAQREEILDALESPGCQRVSGAEREPSRDPDEHSLGGCVSRPQ